MEQRRWLTPSEFTDLLGLCQFLPGGNVINLTVAVGLRFRGAFGALAPLLGLIAAPSAIVIGFGMIYDRYHDDPHVQHVFVGMAAAGAGLLIMMPVLVSLALIFSQLSLLAFDGGNSMLPEMQRQVVDVHGWMSAADFSALFALAQAAPGPNLMVVVLVGWHVAGWPGLIVTSIAKFGPSLLVTVFALGLWDRFRDRTWRRIVQQGLLPMTAGLVAASAVLIAEASATHWSLAAITAASAMLGVLTRLHPLCLLAGGALLGLSGIGVRDSSGGLRGQPHL